jgi:hypothetical protein
MPAKASTWTGFFAVVGAAAAVVAVVSGIAGVITYFATKTELHQLEEEARADLQKLKCEATARLDLVDANTALLYNDQGAFNARLVLVNNSSSEQEKERLKYLIDGYEKNSIAARQQQAEANGRLANCSL